MADSAKQSATTAAFDNPLMPNARLRAIYQAILWTQMLAKALPTAQRGRGVSGQEACLVSPCIDLGEKDLISDALTGGVVDFVRGAQLTNVLLGASKKSRGAGLVAGCGGAKRLPVAKGFEQRVWVAIGAAAALKAAGSGVVVMYVAAAEATGAAWSKALRYVADTVLPIIVIVLPERSGAASSANGVSAGALRCGVPGIAVDADDAVALYRVAQESIGRARIGGGAAVIECVPFVPVGTTDGSRPGQGDPVKALARYMLPRGVVTQQWMDREARAFDKRRAVLQGKAALGIDLAG